MYSFSPLFMARWYDRMQYNEMSSDVTIMSLMNDVSIIVVIA